MSGSKKKITPRPRRKLRVKGQKDSNSTQGNDIHIHVEDTSDEQTFYLCSQLTDIL